jgi:hypothetical protein
MPENTIMPSTSSPQHSSNHFKDKDAVGHVVEAQARGIIAQSESHAHEIPGYLSAATDAARDTALLFVLLWLLFTHLNIPHSLTWQATTLAGGCWLLWRSGRSAWLGWSRLERLHRVLKEEKWEIEHHRSQEREELKALYAAKGFQGKLLDDVMDVLMADGDRLLRVMIEEELGLSLEKEEHPLQQALGAMVGSSCALFICMIGTWLNPSWGLFTGAFIVTICASIIATYAEENRLIPSIVWNVGIIALPLACMYFLLPYLAIA